MSALTDAAATILGYVPSLMATANLYGRAPSLAPGAKSPQWNGAWVAITGQLQEQGRSQNPLERTNEEKRTALLLVSSALAIDEGWQISVSQAQPIWIVSGRSGMHRTPPGLVIWALSISQSIVVGMPRGGGRL